MYLSNTKCIYIKKCINHSFLKKRCPTSTPAGKVTAICNCMCTCDMIGNDWLCSAMIVMIKSPLVFVGIPCLHRTVLAKERCGRLREVSDGKGKAWFEWSQSTFKELQVYFAADNDIVHRFTVQHTFHKGQLNERVILKKPSLRIANKQRCLRYAKAHLDKIYFGIMKLFILVICALHGGKEHSVPEKKSCSLP